MKHSIAFLIFSFSIAFNNSYAGICNKDLRFVLAHSKKVQENASRFSEIELKEEIGRLESVIHGFRSKKENPEPAINLYYNKTLSEIDAHLITESYSVAHRLLRTTFREVEFSFFYIKKISPLYQKLKTLNPELLTRSVQEIYELLKFSKKDIALIEANTKNISSGNELLSQLHNSLDYEKSILARNYQGYSLYRNHLENIANDATCTDGTCKNGAAKMLSKLGVESDKEQNRFLTIFKGASRPSLGDIQAMVSSDNYMNILRLKVERNFEIAHFISNFLLQPQVVDTIFNQLINFPGMHKTKLVRLFRSIYNRQARELYFPKVNKIIRAKEMNPADRLGLLRELNTTVDNDEFLIAFARRIDNKAIETWDSLKKTADESDQDFAKRMTEAKKKAMQRGGLSNVYKKSYVSTLAAVLIAGGTGSYFYFTSDPTVETTEVRNDDEEIRGGFTSTEITEEDIAPAIDLPDVNETIDGRKQEPFFPEAQMERQRVLPQVNAFDKEIESNLRLLEDFALREYSN